MKEVLGVGIIIYGVFDDSRTRGKNTRVSKGGRKETGYLTPSSKSPFDSRSLPSTEL